MPKVQLCFARRFKDIKHTRLLKDYKYEIGTNKYLILSWDGVQHFSSKKVNCPCCLEKKQKDGGMTYHHHMLCAALVNPKKCEVFIMVREPFVQQDGTTKRIVTHQFSHYQQTDTNGKVIIFT